MKYEFHFNDLMPYTGMFVDGLTTTLKLAAIALVLSFLLGTAVAFGRVFGSRSLQKGLAAYVELARNTPFLVQLFFIFFGLSSLGLRLSPFSAAAVALVFNSSTYIAEVLRAGIVSLPKGQVEAARVLGMSQGRIILDILLLQIVSRMYPALCAQLNIMVLNTSVSSAIAVDDLTGVSMIVASNTYRSFEVFAVMSVVYLVLTLAVSGLLQLIGFLAFPWQRA